MHRLIIPIVAILIVGTVLVSGRLGPASAHQASSDASPAADCPTTSEEENQALVRRYYEEAYNGRNLAVIDELLSDDFVRHNVAAPQQDQQPGHADDIARVEAWLSAFPDLQVAIENLYASSDTVVSWQVWTGTQDGPLTQWGAPETGLPMARESLVVWRVICGELAENWIVQDNLTMLRQLGIITDDELATAGTPTVATPEP
jgi:predicted ester cyclase